MPAALACERHPLAGPRGRGRTAVVAAHPTAPEPADLRTLLTARRAQAAAHLQSVENRMRHHEAYLAWQSRPSGLRQKLKRRFVAAPAANRDSALLTLEVARAEAAERLERVEVRLTELARTC